ncbi:energy transducer TonB [Pseudooceanicola sp.]|uniref:energy transducer TonB n=1 Tax=Pseudooceanicola sp. TaxID=1914328 RepID=UPI0026078D03|nr:energy transducer TonB [Pseudooceanicola sp.]MDF1856539.1 energy transducer TonB [Pseudooceanicola sp.]
MHFGHVISGTAHAGLIGWLLVGSIAVPPAPQVAVTEVAMVSEQEFAALMAAQDPPGAATDVAEPTPPASDDTAPPEVSTPRDAQPDSAPPEVSEAARPDPVPVKPEPIPPQPQEVTDTAPVIEPPSEDIAALRPEPRPEPAPRDVPRVAPRPVLRPEPDVKVDDQVREPAQKDAAAEDKREEQEATAPEAATTEIVTEAEKDKSLAPTTSVRPKARPPVREAAAQQAETPKPADTPAAKPGADTAINAALEKALTGGDSGNESGDRAAPTGPPLTGGEKDALRVAVSTCWNTGSLSSDALRVTVVVSVAMAEDGRPQSGSIRMLSSSGGSDAAARQAFEAARRAIIRCGTRGYELPREKYEQWRDIEMTFNPEKMRIK